MSLPAGALRPILPDPIFGLSEAYAADSRSQKINLTVGIYVDDRGQTPVLQSVLEAERRLVEAARSKTYRPIEGDQLFRASIAELVFGSDAPRLKAGSAIAFQAPGGTGALRIAADFAMQTGGRRVAWVPEPTWPNHPGVFGAAGFEVNRYPYVRAGDHGIAIPEMLRTLEAAGPGDVIVLQASCHNPTGSDPSFELWREIAQIAVARGVLPIIDFAYQGFGDGLREDAAWLAAFDQPELEFLIATSYSKNFSLYNERVGGLIVVASSPDRAAAASRHVKGAIRSNYSNPPAHGADIVSTVLNDADLRGVWEREVAHMRGRIQEHRRLLVDALESRGGSHWEFVRWQRGMFAYLGLTDDVVTRLRDEDAIYLVAGGRINLAGLAAQMVDRIADAILHRTPSGSMAVAS